jgi:hypothetical protein
MFRYDLQANSGDAGLQLRELLMLAEAEGWPASHAGEVGHLEVPTERGPTRLRITTGAAGSGVLTAGLEVTKLPSIPEAVFGVLADWNASSAPLCVRAVCREDAGRGHVSVEADLVPALGAESPFNAAVVRQVASHLASADAALQPVVAAL